MLKWNEKKKKLYDRLKEETRKPVCLALSGGVDSALLAYLLGKCGRENKVPVYGVTFDTVLHPSADLEAAEKTAQQCGICHHVIRINELEHAGVMKNTKDRCYLCKKYMFRSLVEFADKVHAETVIEGTNKDDLAEYRPGIRAIQELGIFSPWAEYGFTKKEIREWAEEAGIYSAKRPSAPCMATRLPYNTAIDLSLLKKIEESESAIRQLGFPVVRVRVYDHMVRLEVEKEKMPEAIEKSEKIVEILKKQGFTYVTLDMEGFRSGSMDL